MPSAAECNWCDLTDFDCSERVNSDGYQQVGVGVSSVTLLDAE